MSTESKNLTPEEVRAEVERYMDLFKDMEKEDLLVQGLQLSAAPLIAVNNALREHLTEDEHSTLVEARFLYNNQLLVLLREAQGR